MEDKLKNLRSAMDSTVLRGTHFNEEHRNKVRKRTKKKKSNIVRNFVPNIITAAFFIGLLMIAVNIFNSDLIFKDELSINNHGKRENAQHSDSPIESIIPGDTSTQERDSEKVDGNSIDTILGDLSTSDIVPEEYKNKDVILTVDKDLQESVEKIMEEEFMNAKGLPGTELLDRAFVVMMDPNTGEILSLAGKSYEENENGKGTFSDYVKGTYQSAYTMGSSITGATILTGFETGVIQPGTRLIDEPLKIKGTVELKSWKDMGNINDLDALRMSSNVYMYKTAMAIGGNDYQHNMSLKIKPETFSILRNQFGLFGLGVKTEVDLPNENMGELVDKNQPGYLLDLSIGQLDKYTPLQLAQYVSTIANGGYRMKPQMVKEIREQPSSKENSGQIISSMKPEVLNSVAMDEIFMKRVQEGFRQAMQENGGTASAFFDNKEYMPAGKTGVAQSYYEVPDSSKYNEPSYNLTFVGYAPHDKPEVAFSVVVPWAYDDNTHASTINKSIGVRILDAYFQLKRERDK
jgi:penicillin-binding protein A